MKLQTQIPIGSEKYDQIDYNSNVLLLGSCFAQNIGSKFNYFKFQHTINPFGILFHSTAIERLVTKAINEEGFTEDDIFNLDERWHCFDAHSDLSASSKEDILGRLNDAVSQTHRQILEATHVVITLGTAWVYRHIERDKIVANCHKVPQKKFLKELLSVEEITASLEAIIQLVRSLNPKAAFIFTLSPVRHLKDGFVENKRSKAHALSAIHNVVDRRQRQYYFPAYEIMMDELRDYRFYKDDMIHPNTLAIDYIWNAFVNTWIHKDAYAVMDKVDFIQRGLHHRPVNENSEAHQLFLEKIEDAKQQLRADIQHITF